MALASTFAAAVEGVGAHTVTVEANVGPGLPGMHIVGLGDTAVRESRDRIRTAVANSRLPWPRTKIMVSLSPANLPKSGSHFDLAVALAVIASMDPRAEKRLARALIVGELGLAGQLRRVDGILQILMCGLDGGVDTIIIPRANSDEAALLTSPRVFVADTLVQVWQWAVGERELDAVASVARESGDGSNVLDFADVAGHEAARWACEVAAAGAHHMMMVGAPGSGKSMLAARLPSILPPLSPRQMVETTAIHSLSGESAGHVFHRAPFVAPHPSLTKAALIGGGSGTPQPGAVSRAHNGVLFLDEASEIPPATLDALRIPLENGEVALVRNRREICFPAHFQLVLAANPCACGAEEAARCTCSSAERQRYLKNISGPLRDRIDISLRTTSVGALVDTHDAEPSREIAQRVAHARERASFRWSAAGVGETTNSRVPAPLIRRHHPATESAMAYLSAQLAGGVVTQRGVDRVLKLAWTIADLAGAAQPGIDHVAQAVDLRAGAGQEVAL